MRPQGPVRDPLQHLSASDQKLFYEYGVGPSVASPFECVHHAFEYHARNQPDAVAVEDFDSKINYAELDRQANCLAGHLKANGVTVDSRVCFLAERSIPMIVGILGILKAGAAYVPLDGNIVSDSTLKHALLGSEAPVVLVLKKFISRVDGRHTIVLEDTICQDHASVHCVKPQDFSTSKHGVYVIYTSGRFEFLQLFIFTLTNLTGTTGVPKGVDVTHGNATNRERITIQS